MVSALTDRLFSGYSSSETNSSNGRLSIGGDKAGPTTDSGGYSADQEQSAQGTPPPFYIDLLSRHHKRNASGDLKDGLHDDRKRAQEEREVNYLAHVARHEIARGGLKRPKLNCKKPRLLPCPVDMSRVTLVHSKDFFAVPRKPVSTSAWNVTHMMSPDLCMETLQSIVKSCSEHYQGRPASRAETFVAAAEERSATRSPAITEGDISDAASTTSSVTEDGTDEAASSSAEDSSKVAISMGQALTLSKQPRMIVIADAPYTLVHCNAAFLEMTGMPSSKILGRPLVDALDEQTLDIGNNFWSLHHKQLYLRCSSAMMASGISNVACRVRLSPIGAQLESVSHISIELDPPGEMKEAWDASERPIFMPPTAEEPPVKVVA